MEPRAEPNATNTGGQGATPARILAMICTTGPMNAADIASAYEADPGQISRAVAELLRKGMIKRERQIGGGNVKTINPTADGTRAFAMMHETRQAYFKSIMGGLSDEQLHEFDRILTHIAQRVDEERNAAGPPSAASDSRSGLP